MSKLRALSPLQRSRRDQLQIQIDAEDETLQRLHERYARDRRRARLRETIQRVANPITVTLLILALIALAAVVLSSPHPSSPYGDPVGPPSDFQASQITPRPLGHQRAGRSGGVGGAARVASPAPWRCQPASGPLRAAARVTAKCVGVPQGLVDAVGFIESTWRPHVVGKAGEYGPMQLSEPVARRWQVNRHDPHENILGGVLELRWLYDRTGDWTRAVTRYNGSGPMARAYAQRVLRAWEAAQ